MKLPHLTPLTPLTYRGHDHRDAREEYWKNRETYELRAEALKCACILYQSKTISEYEVLATAREFEQYLRGIL